MTIIDGFMLAAGVVLFGALCFVVFVVFMICWHTVGAIKDAFKESWLYKRLV